MKEQKAKKALEDAKVKASQGLSGDVNKVGSANESNKKLDDSRTQQSQHGAASSQAATNGNTTQQQQQQSENSGKQSMKPVFTISVPNTPWCVVWTDRGRVFYFNPSTKTSVWDRPAVLRDREDVDKMVSTPPANLNLNKSSSQTSVTEDESSRQSTSSEQNGQAEKKVKLESNGQSDSNNGSNCSVITKSNASTPKTVVVKPKEDTSAIEKEAAKKREIIPYEERVKTFREMLDEKNIDPTSTFQGQLAKIVFDPRYLLLTSAERRKTFERYCSEKMEQEQKKRREKIKIVTADFKALLAESNLTSRSTFEQFHEQNLKDPRYQALEKTKDREMLFEDHLAHLRRKERDAEKAQQQQQRVQQPSQIPSQHLDRRRSHSRSRSRSHRSTSRVPCDEAERIYQALLIELISEPNLSWHDAKRIMRKSTQWNHVYELPREWMESVFERHLDKIYHRRKEKFHQLLDETKEIDLASDWRDIKRIIREDPRYIKFSSSERRCEREFRDYVKKKRVAAVESFRQLLRETKLIDKDTRRKIEESNHQLLMDIIGTLQSDRRYVELESLSEERRKILLSYIEELASTTSEEPKEATSTATGEVEVEAEAKQDDTNTNAEKANEPSETAVNETVSL